MRQAKHSGWWHLLRGTILERVRSLHAEQAGLPVMSTSAAAASARGSVELEAWVLPFACTSAGWQKKVHTEVSVPDWEADEAGG